MKIGFFTDSYFPEIDGVTYTIDLWRQELEDRGHDVSVVYPDGDHEPEMGEFPIPSLPNPFYAGYRIPLVRRTATLPDFDIVHCHGPAPAGLLGRYYAWKHDCPAVYTHHTPLEEYFHQSVKSKTLAAALSRGYVPLETMLLRTFDVVTASTSRIDREVDHLQLPVGIDMEFFHPTESDWYTASDQPVIGYSGRISMEKNVDEILQVAEACPDYRFVVVGNGPYRDQLEAQQPSNVTFRDFLPREELPVFYSSLDVFFTASTADTLGLATLEANACGTPVVAPDVAPFDRTIGPANGTRYPHGDRDAAVAAIEACLSDTFDTRDAVEEYSVERTISTLEGLYRDVLAADTTPAEAVNPSTD